LAATVLVVGPDPTLTVELQFENVGPEAVSDASEKCSICDPEAFGSLTILVAKLLTYC
jgi:hypothetical protein